MVTLPGVIPHASEAFIAYEKQKSDFRNFARDVAIIIRSPRIGTASGLEDLRVMQLEMAIADGVSSALSIFTLPGVDGETGELQQYFPGVIEDDEQATELLKRLVEDYPQAGNLISPGDNVALLLVALDLDPSLGNDAHAVEVFGQMFAES